MTLHRVQLADCPAQPWRNGGGRTRELLAWPDARDWAVRVSVADIGASGPFSAFAGVERWFAVLDGAGVVLALPGGDVTLRPGDPPLRFDGACAPGCRLTGGATRDLNLMVRRDGRNARMWSAAEGSAIAGPTRWRAIYAAGPAQLEFDGAAEALPAGTLVWSDDHGAARWRLRAPARAWWMAVTS